MAGQFQTAVAAPPPVVHTPVHVTENAASLLRLRMYNSNSLCLSLLLLVFCRSGSDSRGSAILGPSPNKPVQFTENGVRFAADLVQGQKTGFFLDQRDNRRRMQVRGHQFEGYTLCVNLLAEGTAHFIRSCCSL